MGEHSSGFLGVLEVHLEHEESIHREGELWVSIVVVFSRGSRGPPRT